MRIVIVGAGVVGSIYGDRLARSGHDVTLLARGRRLADLRAHGLVVEDASATRIFATHSGSAVGRRSLRSCADSGPLRTGGEPLPILLQMDDRPDVLFFGNTTGHQTELPRLSANERFSVSPPPVAFVTAVSSGPSLSNSRRPCSANRVGP